MKRIFYGLVAIIVASCGAAAPVAAKADTRIGAHLGSYHFSGDFNNFNPGVYLYHDGWTLGTYYNSERNQSAYAGYTFEWHLGGRYSAGLTVGAITGYARAPVLPMAVPSLRVGLGDSRDAALRLSFVPPVGHGSSAALHASIEWRFK